MSEHHYEVRLEQDLANIRARIADIAGSVATAVRNSMEALERFDHRLAYETILNDNPINREVEACDQLCHYFVARHLPTARHLRFISSVMRLNIVLERVGDYAATICRVAVQLSEPIDSATLDRLKTIAYGATDMFEQAVGAFIDGNAELATGTIALEPQIDRSFRATLDHVLETGLDTSPTTGDLFGKLVILSTLERVSDQAKNICEYTIFAETGETKQRKAVPVTFLDEDNSRFGPAAVAIGRKAFPDHGVYTTACKTVSEELDPDFAQQMSELGHDLDDVERGNLEENLSLPLTQKVIVILEGRKADYVESVPFHTVIVEWDLSEYGDDFDAVYKTLTVKIGDLMTTLRGE